MATVLFVDDELAILEGLQRALRKESFHVLTASSAADALEILAREPVDVIVSDERMPGRCGADLLERVRRDYPNIVRIGLSGESESPLTCMVERGVPYRILSKPISSPELARTIQEALRVADLTADRHR